MQRWEYTALCFDGKRWYLGTGRNRELCDGFHWLGFLNDLGRSGWEAVSHSEALHPEEGERATILLKRPRGRIER
jgi:hypothetical protein